MTVQSAQKWTHCWRIISKVSRQSDQTGQFPNGTLRVDWGTRRKPLGAIVAWSSLAIFAVMTVVLVGTLGSTIGHLVLGMGVRAAPGTPPGPLRALVRTALLCLVIPAVVWGPDGRGLHDVVAGTTITRIR